MLYIILIRFKAISYIMRLLFLNSSSEVAYWKIFNRNILQQNIKTLPKTAILVRRSELMRLLAGGWKAEEGKMYLYEPGVELYK